jgi:hypothetical protein
MASSSWRAWRRVGSRVAGVPWLRPAYLVADRVIFVWWWYGQGEDGAARWRWYRALDAGFSAVYTRAYLATFAWVLRNIGE